MEYVIRREGNEDHLEHYGIKNQKWGERRFQNYDGTLTEAGKARYLEAKKTVEKGSITGSEKMKNAVKRGVIGGAVGAAVAGGATYDPGSKITNTSYMTVSSPTIGSHNLGPITSSHFRPGKGLNAQNTAVGFAIGFAGTAIGSLIKDSVHNQRVKNAERFIQQYSEAYNKTNGGNS